MWNTGFQDFKCPDVDVRSMMAAIRACGQGSATLVEAGEGGVSILVLPTELPLLNPIKCRNCIYNFLKMKRCNSDATQKHTCFPWTVSALIGSFTA